MKLVQLHDPLLLLVFIVHAKLLDVLCGIRHDNLELLEYTSIYFREYIMSFVVPCFPSHPPSPTQPALMYGCRYTKLLHTIDVIGARPNDFLRMVTLNHALLWVRTIPYVALQNGHVSLKRIPLM